MDLWIRSQDKLALELVHSVGIAHKQEPGRFGILDKPVKSEECYIFVNGSNFGEYKNEQRAIEVLNEIQDSMYDIYETTESDGNVLVRTVQPTQYSFIVYQMPADEGVEND